MKKIVAISNNSFNTVSVNAYDSFLDKMVNDIHTLNASYNVREDDSIYISGFEQGNARECDTNELGVGSLLSIDLLDDDAVREAVRSLKDENNKNILECSTFTQTVFFYALVEMFDREDREVLICNTVDEGYTTEFSILPFNCKADVDRPLLSVDTFFDTEEFNKTEPYELDLQKGDIVYFENYDSYPTEMNGYFSGDYCIVVDDNSEDPLFYGFGVGYVRFEDVKQTMTKDYLNEMKLCKKKMTKQLKKELSKDKIGISMIMRLKPEIFQGVF